jgi:hypothetical protein
MAHPTQEVKSVLTWIDRNPRIGWYIASLATLDVVLDVIGLLIH